jgi:uncharacterized protein YfaS (alpha-2-macroglobulin family)
LQAELHRKATTKASFRFTTNRSQKQVDLDFGGSYYMELLPDEATSIKFDQVKGEVSLSTFFDAYQDPKTIEQNPNAHITRKYRSNGKDTTTLAANELVQVVLTVTPDKNNKNYFQVTDFLPSGLKPFVDTYSYYGYYSDYGSDPCKPSNWYADVSQGNRVSFTVYRPDSCGTGPIDITYYARVTSLGSFTADQAFVQGLGDDQRKTLSGKSDINIK